MYVKHTDQLAHSLNLGSFLVFCQNSKNGQPLIETFLLRDTGNFATVMKKGYMSVNNATPQGPFLSVPLLVDARSIPKEQSSLKAPWAKEISYVMTLSERPSEQGILISCLILTRGLNSAVDAVFLILMLCLIQRIFSGTSSCSEIFNKETSCFLTSSKALNHEGKLYIIRSYNILKKTWLVLKSIAIRCLRYTWQGQYIIFTNRIFTNRRLLIWRQNSITKHSRNCLSPFPTDLINYTTYRIVKSRVLFASHLSMKNFLKLQVLSLAVASLCSGCFCKVRGRKGQPVC